MRSAKEEFKATLESAYWTDLQKVPKFPQMGFHQLGPTGPSWSVSRHVCGCVCLCVRVRHRETPTSGGHADLWSKIAFLILVWDDTLKKKGGSNFLAKLLKRAILDPPPKSRPLIGPQVT